MIEDLTPQLLSVAMLLVIALATTLTFTVSALILWLYRRRVRLAMAASASAPLPAGSAARGEQHAAADASPSFAPPRVDSTGARAGREPTAFRSALRAPWLAAARMAGAGLAFAGVTALAEMLAFPGLRTLPWFAAIVWIASWPAVLGLGVTAPGGARLWAFAISGYVVPLLLYVLAAVLQPGDAALLGADLFELRDGLTPPRLLRIWLLVNGAPTLLLLLFLNPWLRAVGPLVLAFMTIVATGLVVFGLTLMTRSGRDFGVWLTKVSGWLPSRTIPLVTVLVVLAFAALAWRFAYLIRRGYVQKRSNDRSLILDAVWLLFAMYYAMWFALVGVAWVAAGLLAFAAYKLAGAAARGLADAPATRDGLIFLRVFALGRRSDALLDALGRHWRHIGSMHLITGPDVAASTVQPHQMLDFLSGRLASHFVRDAASLERRLRVHDTEPDRDGLFRVNNFFCHADTWEAAFARLVQEGHAVLMDLRSFSSSNAGCVHELRHLLHRVPLARCVLVVDDSTDGDFLQRTLAEALRDIDAESPNRGVRLGDIAAHRYDGRGDALRALLERLCVASRAAQPGFTARPAISIS